MGSGVTSAPIFTRVQVEVGVTLCPVNKHGAKVQTSEKSKSVKSQK